MTDEIRTVLFDEEDGNPVVVYSKRGEKIIKVDYSVTDRNIDPRVSAIQDYTDTVYYDSEENQKFHENLVALITKHANMPGVQHISVSYADQIDLEELTSDETIYDGNGKSVRISTTEIADAVDLYNFAHIQIFATGDDAASSLNTSGPNKERIETMMEDEYDMKLTTYLDDIMTVAENHGGTVRRD